MNKYILTAVLTAASFAANSQTLSEEVFIDREITPVVRQTVRPSWVNPTLLTPNVRKNELKFNEYYGSAPITRSLTPLEPVAWADSVMRSPYHGYASLGYFPVYNLGAGAGYRFLHSDKYNAGAKFSYDGSSWSGYETADGKYRSDNISLGADGTAKFNAGLLKAALDYTYSSTDMPRYEGDFDRGTQAINMVDLNLKWVSTTSGALKWDVAFNLGYGGFTKDKTLAMSRFRPSSSFRFEPVKDLSLGAKSNLYYALKEKSGIALGVGLNFRHLNDYTRLVPTSASIENLDYAFATPDDLGSTTMGIITLKPGYCFTVNKFKGRLGVAVDFNTGGLQKDVHIAPDVEIQWVGSSLFGAVLRATGGEVMNTNASLWRRSPWMTGTLAMERSHVNADVDLALTFGSYKGFRAMVYGGFSSVSDWAVPVLLQDANTWGQIDQMNGWHYGLELGYAWKNLVNVKAHAEGASHGKYYRWQDNAKWVFDIAAKVRPIDKLQLEVGYSVRVDRFGYTLIPTTNGREAYYNSASGAMGDTSNLFVGGEYEFTSALSFFLKAENLLNHHWQIAPGVRSNGIRGLLGAQLKF